MRRKGLAPRPAGGWYTADKTEPVCTTMDRVGTLPFVAQPGDAWVYGYNTDILNSGRVRRAPEGARGQGHYVDGPRVSFAGGAGRIATARDYARFLQMIAHGGRWNGRQ